MSSGCVASSPTLLAEQIVEQPIDSDYIIRALGGPNYLSRVLGCTAQAVCSWRSKGIPAGRCLQLAEVAHRRRLPHLTVEVIIRALPPSAYEVVPRKPPPRL